MPQLAERAGISAIAVHGRTRADRFQGNAEYETIRAVKQAVRIPVIANGDVGTAQQAQAVLEATGADAVMIGRAALGSPWIFRDVNAFLDRKKFPPPLLRASITAIILKHLETLYAFYGEYSGVRMARKHLSRYCDLDGECRAVTRGAHGGGRFRVAVRACGTCLWTLGKTSDFRRTKTMNRTAGKDLPLRNHTERVLSDYFSNLNGHRPARLYNLVLREVEEPLLRAVLDYADGNQSQAAEILGITRTTLRKKLRSMGLNE